MVTIETETCVGCGECMKDCVSGALRLVEGKAAYAGECIHCGHCVAICPVDAVSIPDYDMADVEQLEPADRGLDAAQLLRALKARRSIRRYTDQKIERDKLEILIQAGRYTATGVNRQACRFIVVQDGLETLKEMVWSGIRETLANPPAGLSPEILRPLGQFLKLREEGGTDYLFRNAPAALYIAAESTVDAALAAQSIEMAAVAQGLGALYNGYLVYTSSGNQPVLDWLGTDGKPIAVCMLLGYPNIQYKRTAPRKPADVNWL